MHFDPPSAPSAARRCAALLLLLPLIGLSATALAQTSSPDVRLARVGALPAEHKPAGVPDDYVQTPFGYFPPACVRQVHNGERLLKDGGLQHANGTREQAQACTQDNFTPNGTRVRPDGRGIDGQQVRGNAALAASRSRRSVPASISNGYMPASISKGYLKVAGYYTGTPLGRIVASWTVPQNPTNVAQQTVYFFPGLQSNDPTILQPVLGYRGENNAWDLSSWNCCQEGTVWYSDYIKAKAGDQIVGDTYATCGTGNPCYDWNVDTRNLTTGQSVRLSTTYDIDSESHQVMGGSLEVYSLDSCDQYPPEGSITFTNIGVYDYQMNRVRSPPWGVLDFSSGYDMQCDYDVQTTSTSATIFY
ncbi:hypothetical protein [Xanthomonas translucens]|uniref:hypothetical protein n=1 Tax=Xanthomonas campestris pv. translucens TaxID=343 RepID=UPI0002A7B2B5|nr:hypothetical protein [Xanthomonas translucens]AKK68628.1 hypothetical protein FD63_14710 [Xanthomonas translucens pv. undulosa]AVY65865.1 hypothetical protein NZ30_05705 [Xanthomonas translucens pv. undulosa]ELQ15784.1 hypothetical protein A989_03367 [Xanthomonas translucens DAR61454]KTF39904.1 hypothetical protein OZ12_09665 [Xanthomonas translucens pv. translucens]KWV10534.1 hypothetical protein ATB54_00995 [Xanthomonas translucens]